MLRPADMAGSLSADTARAVGDLATVVSKMRSFGIGSRTARREFRQTVPALRGPVPAGHATAIMRCMGESLARHLSRKRGAGSDTGNNPRGAPDERGIGKTPTAGRACFQLAC